LLKQNLLLASLCESDLQALASHLRPIKLEQQRVLFDTNEAISLVYFPVDAIVSLVVTLTTGKVVEAAMVGKDGVIGAAAALDGKISLSRAIVQIGGTGFGCEPGALKQLALAKPSVLSLVVRHEQTVYAQAQQSAACNVTHSVEARLARWLLRARDLAASDTLPFTQEFLAEILGATRPTVSVIAHTLQQAGLIKYKRGRIQIVNLEGLQEAACECYATIEKHYSALLNG